MSDQVTASMAGLEYECTVETHKRTDILLTRLRVTSFFMENPQDLITELYLGDGNLH